MKKIIFIFLFFMSFWIFTDKVSALEYQSVTKKDLIYEINGFYISNDHLIVNGWAIMADYMQNYFNDNTHSYSLVLKNINDSSDVLTYNGTLLWTDKTDLFKYVSTSRRCSSTAVWQHPDNCYMTLQNVGFEFKIPLSHLRKDTSYKATLRMHSKQVNKAYQTDIFAPNIRQYQEKDGIRYELYSDYSTTKIVMLSDILFVKEGPSTSSARAKSWQSCSLTGNTLYWKQWELYTSLQETAKTNNSYDAETWFRVLYNQGLCLGGRSRAYMGWSYSGWMPSVYTDFDGTPAIVKITTQNNASIDQIKTYTSPINSKTKASIKLYNKINQTTNIKLYQDNSLVYNNSITFNGTKDINIDFTNNGGKNIKAIITEPSGYVSELNAPIYNSSYNKYNSSSNEITINPTTPIIVITDKFGTNNIYERIKVSIPYNTKKITSGKPIQTWSYIEYFTDNNEIVLNNDIKGNVLFPSQDKSLNYNIINNKVLVDTIKTDSNTTQAILNLPEYVLDKIKGNVYLKGQEPSGIKTIYGDRKWYIPLTEKIGKYDYQINTENLGVNKISVKFDCNYEITNSLFGSDDSEYIIKRTYIPTNPLFRFHKQYTYQELLNIGGAR